MKIGDKTVADAKPIPGRNENPRFNDYLLFTFSVHPVQ